MQVRVHWLLILPLGLLCFGCGGTSATVPTAVAPSPTVSAGVPAITPSPAAPMPTELIVRPAEPSPPVGSPTGGAQTNFVWPTYIPAGFQVSPTESRVSDENATGVNGLAYYVVTLNNGTNKIVVGGGGIDGVLPLKGDERVITIGSRTGHLIANGEQREIVFDVPTGKLFLYSAGVSEDELLKIAGSLQPIDVQVVRALANPTR